MLSYNTVEWRCPTDRWTGICFGAFIIPISRDAIDDRLLLIATSTPLQWAASVSARSQPASAAPLGLVSTRMSLCDYEWIGRPPRGSGTPPSHTRWLYRRNLGDRPDGIVLAGVDAGRCASGRNSATSHYTDPTRPDKVRRLVRDPREHNGLCRGSRSQTRV